MMWGANVFWVPTGQCKHELFVVCNERLFAGWGITTIFKNLLEV